VRLPFRRRASHRAPPRLPKVTGPVPRLNAVVAQQAILSRYHKSSREVQVRGSSQKVPHRHDTSPGSQPATSFTVPEWA